MDEMAVMAAAFLAVALSSLWPGERVRVLRLVGGARARAAPDGWRPNPPGWYTPTRLRVGLVAGLAGWLLIGPSWGGAGIGLACVPVAMLGLAWLEAEPDRQAARRLTAQLPGCLDLLAAALDAGAPLRAAVRHVAGLVPEPSAALLGGVLGHLEIGRSDAQAWLSLRDHPVWGPMARDLARSADSGAAVAEVLGVHATEARARRTAQRESAARTVGVRSVLPLVCCFLPAFVLVGVVPIIAATLSSFTQPR